MAVRLVDIPEIAQSLKSANTKAISLLNTIVFGTPHDRNTRSKLREFTGFNNSDLTEKITEIKSSFTLSDLIHVANILHLDIVTDQDKLCDSIFQALLNLNELKQKISDSNINSEIDELPEVTISDAEQFSSVPRSHIHENAIHPAYSTAQHTPIFNNSPSENNLTTHHQPFSLGFSLKDIADEIKNFDGTSNYPISSFIEAVSNVSTLYNLSDIQTLAVAKRCITGTAKIFFNSLPHITSWQSFQDYFIDEFDEKFTAADIHKMLSERHLHKGESCTEYLIKMREIANKASIDEKSVCQYVIQGLPQSPNKLLLYGCNSFKELKQKIILFENLQKEQANSSVSHRNFAPSENYRPNKFFRPPRTDSFKPTDSNVNNFSVRQNLSNNTSEIKCYQCGERSHVASTCSYNQIRCFYCKNFGHKIINCPKKATKTSADASAPVQQAAVNQISTTDSSNFMKMQISISDTYINALVDSGSAKTIMRKSVYKCIGSPSLNVTSITLNGLGVQVVRPIGFFHTKIKIQNTDFETDIFVVNDNLLSFDVILGYDVLQQGEFSINKNGVKLIENITSTQNFSVNYAVPIVSEDFPYHSTAPKFNSATSDNKNVVHNTSVPPGFTHMIPDRNPLLSAPPSSSKSVFSPKLCAPECTISVSSLSKSPTSESFLSESPTSESFISELPYPESSHPVSSSTSSVVDQVSQKVNNLVTKVCDTSSDAQLLSTTEHLQTRSSELNSLNHVLVSELKTYSEILQFEQSLHTTISLLKMCQSEKLKCLISKMDNISQNPPASANNSLTDPTKRSPSELPVGVPMKNEKESLILSFLQEQYVKPFTDPYVPTNEIPQIWSSAVT